MRRNKDRQNIKYFLYARKSQDEEDRQVQSIGSQIDKLKELIRDLDLNVKKIYTEEMTAKEPGRPVFNEMVERIENGEANGILTWKINRISRNPIDSGKICWLLQNEIIKSVQTYHREFLPEDNVIIFSVEAAESNQYILDLSRDVKRGNEKKRKRGWLPNMAPQGYLNDKATKTIVNDPDRYHLIKKMLKLMLTGAYTPPKILKIANEDWGYRTRKTKKTGGKPLSRSGIYRVFGNIFYAGFIKHDGKLYEGKHEPMITLEEFDRIQALLGRKSRPKPKTHEFAFTGFIRCAVCGCLYTAETKKKYIKSAGKIRKYTYYHCTNRKKEIDCPQRKCIREEDLELMIEKELEKYTILPKFRQWALDVLNENNDNEIEQRTKIYEMQHKSLVKTQKELDNLTRMRYRELIDDQTFLKEKKVLKRQIKKLKQKLRQTEERAEHWLELSEKTFNFATYARIAFLKGGLELKKEILMALGQNPIIKANKLKIKANDWFVPIEKGYHALEEKYLALEPEKKPVTQAKKEAISSIRADWLPGLDSNQDKRLQRPLSYH